MDDATVEIVNHIRILIEESEAMSKKKCKKVFFLLLHYPPARFYQSCYPSLFLKGWDHCYLDTIAHKSVENVQCVDIKEWFRQCCFPQELETDVLLNTLHDVMLPQAIPVLDARIMFGCRQKDLFSYRMKQRFGSQQKETLGDLFKKGSKKRTVGWILCTKFREYWKPKVMVEQLKKAAYFSRGTESTLNITETIQTFFEKVFYDFLVYMISRANECYNIDILFDDSCTEVVETLFLSILQVLPTPIKLSTVCASSNNLSMPKPHEYAPQFPFFHTVYDIVESIVVQCRKNENLNKSESIGTSVFSDSLTSKSILQIDTLYMSLLNSVTSRISKVRYNARNVVCYYNNYRLYNSSPSVTVHMTASLSKYVMRL